MNKNLNYLLAEYEEFILVAANGEFPQSQDIIDYVKSSTFIVACDGAINKLHKYGITANLVIGDGDSVNSQDKSILREKYIFDPDQSTNDLTKAINYIQNNSGTQNKIIIIGASGLREDHSLANFGLLANYGLKFSSICMLSNYGILQPFNTGCHRLRTLVGQQISFFALSDQTQITCDQLKWPLNKLKLPNLSSGTLNQAITNYIEFECTGNVLVYRAFEIKNN